MCVGYQLRAVSQTWCLVFTMNRDCLNGKNSFSECFLFKDMCVRRRNHISVVSGRESGKHGNWIVFDRFLKFWMKVTRSFANTGHLLGLTALLALCACHTISFNHSKMSFSNGQHRRTQIAKNGYPNVYRIWNHGISRMRIEEMRSKMKKVMFIYDR